MAYVKFTNLQKTTWLAHKKFRLINLDLELTERCNNACIHCYINQPQDNRKVKDREMDTKIIKDILHQAADLGCLSVRFTGGEPLLREDFSDIYVFARQLGFQVEILTNATLISTQLCQLFQRLPPGKPLSVTVYGMHAHSYDTVVGRRGAFKEFRKGINLLQDYKIPFKVKQSLLPQNKHEMAEFEAFSASLPHMEHPPTYSINFDLRGRRDDQSKNRLISKLRYSPEETLELFTRQPDKYIKGMQAFAKKHLGHPSNLIFSCGAGANPCVDAFGNLQLCMLLRHPDTIYPLDSEQHHINHPETDLPPLEYGLKVFFPEVRRLTATNPEYLNRCAKCFLSGLCEQCPAKSWEEHGTLDMPVEYQCEVTHAQAQFLGLIQNGEKAWTLPPQIWKERLAKFVANNEDKL